MALEIPNSMDECIYFTRRTEGEKGHLMAWAHKIDCPNCHKALMGKPVEKGKIKVRATEYVCPECDYTESKADHEAKLEVNCIYTCPHCEHKGEATMPYQRKTWQGVKAFIFNCESCGEKIGITKKMKEPKKKK